MNEVGGIFLIVIVIFLALFSLWLSQPSTKGMYGEFLVKRQLNKLAIRFNGLAYHNLMFGEGDYSTQLDNLLITSKGVYVIEVKNYAGRIYGNQYQDQWQQTIKYVNTRRGRRGRMYTKTHIEKNPLFNPIKQNQIHVNAIKRNILSIQGLPIYNMVVFTNQTDLTNIEMKDDSSYVMNRRHLNRFVKTFEQKLSSYPIELMRVDAEIKSKNTYSKVNLQNHIQKIKNKYKK